jgi:hypothetical protein
MKSNRNVVGLVLLLAAAIGTRTTTHSDEAKPSKPKGLLVESVQPDYSKWESVKVGMTEDDVRKLLGNPIEDPESPGLVFGRIRFDSPSMPDSFNFYVMIHEGKVLEKGDAFGGNLSRDGRPTTPKLIYPRDRTTFDHYPRFVDLRWKPSSGKYPIEYAIEIQMGQYEVRGADGNSVLVYHNADDLVSELPYAAFAFRGRNPGRWRVKAKNELGESEWSEWRMFAFEQ